MAVTPDSIERRLATLERENARLRRQMDFLFAGNWPRAQIALMGDTNEKHGLVVTPGGRAFDQDGEDRFQPSILWEPGNARWIMRSDGQVADPVWVTSAEAEIIGTITGTSFTIVDVNDNTIPIGIEQEDALITLRRFVLIPGTDFTVSAGGHVETTVAPDVGPLTFHMARRSVI